MSQNLTNNINLKDRNFINNVYDSIKKEYHYDQKIFNYLNQLDDNEIKALVISKIMLESSFSVEKCIGFLNYDVE